MQDEQGVFVGVSDYLKSVGIRIAKWLPGELIALGTDGFGLSEDRVSLREHFEIDPANIALAALDGLRRTGHDTIEDMQHLIIESGFESDKRDPAST